MNDDTPWQAQAMFDALLRYAARRVAAVEAKAVGQHAQAKYLNELADNDYSNAADLLEDLKGTKKAAA